MKNSFIVNVEHTILTIGDTPDMLYWKGEKYLIDRSFLSMKEGYKEIYRNLGTQHELRPVKTWGDIRGAKYNVQWLLKDNTLYLREIEIYDQRVYIYYPGWLRYSEMEKFTGCKFHKSKDLEFARLEPKESVKGSIKATWVDGVFYVKKPRKDPQETFEMWCYTPYLKLTFKSGRLISDKIVIPNNKPRK